VIRFRSDGSGGDVRGARRSDLSGGEARKGTERTKRGWFDGV